MANLRCAIFGTGFWSLYQIPAWHEVGGVDIVACYNRTVSRAESVAQRFGIPRVYGNPEELLQNEELDFIDIITEVPAHEPLVLLAARYKVPVICQKPMAASYESARRMVDACKEAGVPFFVHENYRWQAPVRAAKRMVDEGRIGRIFRGRFQFFHELPEFAWQNQPLLKQLQKLVIADQGSHQLDLARFFMGEAKSLYCQHLQVRDDIAGEDVASITMKMDAAICNVELTFVSKAEGKHFPETTFLLEGHQGHTGTAPRLLDSSHHCRRHIDQSLSGPTLFLGRSRLRCQSCQHGAIAPGLSARVAQRRAAGKYRRGQSQNDATGLCRLRVGSQEPGDCDCLTVRAAMKALMKVKPEPGLVYTDIEQPHIQNPDDVLFKVEYCAICVGETKVYDWNSWAANDTTLVLPTVLGHEAAGVVVEVGPEVTQFKPGDRIVNDPLIYCGHCRQCREGFTNMCENREIYGKRRGAFAEYAVLPERVICPLPDKLSLQEGTVLENLGIAVHAVEIEHHDPGDWAVIIGAGPIGILAAQTLVAWGVNTIITDLSDARLEFAEQHSGAIPINVKREDPVAAVMHYTKNKGADFVIEMAANQAAMDNAFDMVRIRGTIVTIGTFNDPDCLQSLLQNDAARDQAAVGDGAQLGDLAAHGAVGRGRQGRSQTADHARAADGGLCMRV